MHLRGLHCLLPTRMSQSALLISVGTSIPETSACSMSSEKTLKPNLPPAWPQSAPIEVSRGNSKDKRPSLTWIQTGQPPCKGQGNRQSLVCSREQRTYPCRDMRRKQIMLRKTTDESNLLAPANSLDEMATSCFFHPFSAAFCLQYSRRASRLGLAQLPNHNDTHANQTRSSVLDLGQIYITSPAATAAQYQGL